MASDLKTQAPTSAFFLVSYPAPHILLITINRPKARNSLHYQAQWEADAILNWFDGEPSLPQYLPNIENTCGEICAKEDTGVAIITGTGPAFCAGQDLIEQAKIRASPPPPALRRHPPSGFAGISRRSGKKPIIAAVNGFALGGGFEICLNCDIVIASPTASFGLPEVTVGLYAGAGGLPRVVHTAGLQIASEIALTGRRLTPQEALSYRLINSISSAPEELIPDAVKVASRIASLSPDAVIITRAGLREAWETGSVEGAVRRTSERFDRALGEGENIRIGTEAFAGKKKPVWVPSKI
ncbi:related to enoyl-CoA hydratase [Rhynchosporium secalis]|uniref:Related to enoyl-CoA hydratase n=1 Tax=Rhynchosporium secalis TaxID=38038 RepID=A0A1E1MR82_RHYSE|nr:related to enoyl-CoA hydratase [Rhynchosporium secalis]